jgi:hypothetical protein
MNPDSAARETVEITNNIAKVRSNIIASPEERECTLKPNPCSGKRVGYVGEFVKSHPDSSEKDRKNPLS